jgi:hypothetical protein
VQKQWLYDLDYEGYDTVVCHSFDEAKQAIIDYLGIRDKVKKSKNPCKEHLHPLNKGIYYGYGYEFNEKTMKIKLPTLNCLRCSPMAS